MPSDSPNQHCVAYIVDEDRAIRKLLRVALESQEYRVVCMNEQPIQLLKETRVPVAATKNHPRRVDYEYERAGTASIFLFCEPLSGWPFANQRPATR